MFVREALRDAAARLRETCETGRLDAELLMAHALGVSREELLLGHLDAAAPQDFGALIGRRLAHEPVAYITGSREFYSLEIAVTPDVLIPRADSETLIDAALDSLADRPPARILDLGTGSGALLLAALSQWPEASGIGVDLSETALLCARGNAQWLAMEGRASFVVGDWAEGIAGPFDLILCNPPYVETDAALPPDVRDYEPGEALFAGRDGLDAYRILAPQLARLLHAGGIACVEIGASQARAVVAIFAEESMELACRRDLAGRPRCLVIHSAGR